MNFEQKLASQYDLGATSEYFGGWLPYSPDPQAFGMAFPVEGWETSAGVIMRQPAADLVTGELFGAYGVNAEHAWQQALATVSLDGDGSGWIEVGKRDLVIGRLQQRYNYLRPVIFYSPYEAAVNFVIGHRISMAQGRAIRRAMAEQVGDKIDANGVTLHAFPRPQTLLEVTSFGSLNAEKIERLHGIAHAALAGKLDRARLRAMPTAEALAELQTLRGIGGFFAQGILMRGAGTQDELTDEEIGKQAVQTAYNLPALPTQAEVTKIAAPWRPYRTWVTVLLHAWYRREYGGSSRHRAQ